MEQETRKEIDISLYKLLAKIKEHHGSEFSKECKDVISTKFGWDKPQEKK